MNISTAILDQNISISCFDQTHHHSTNNSSNNNNNTTTTTTTTNNNNNESFMWDFSSKSISFDYFNDSCHAEGCATTVTTAQDTFFDDDDDDNANEEEGECAFHLSQFSIDFDEGLHHEPKPLLFDATPKQTQQQEEEQQQQQQQQQRRQSRKKSLRRGVRFSTSPLLEVEVEIHETISRADMTSMELDAAFYTKADYTQMKKLAIQEASNYSNDDDDNNNNNNCGRFSRQRLAQAEKAVASSVQAVLEEQQRQSVCGLYDASLIAKTYQTVTTLCQEEAIRIGGIDRMEAMQK